MRDTKISSIEQVKVKMSGIPKTVTGMQRIRSISPIIREKSIQIDLNLTGMLILAEKGNENNYYNCMAVSKSMKRHKRYKKSPNQNCIDDF